MISLKFHFVPRLRRSFSNPSLFPASRPGLLSYGPSDLTKLRREAPTGNRPERKLGRDCTKELSAEGAALGNESNFGIRVQEPCGHLLFPRVCDKGDD